MTDISYIGYNEAVRSIQIPKYAGSYSINDNFSIGLTKKPSRWNIFWTEFLLGWKWRDNDNTRI